MSVLNYTVRARGKTVNLSQAQTEIKNILPTPIVFNKLSQIVFSWKTVDGQKE